MRPARGEPVRRRVAGLALVLLVSACGSAVAQGGEYTPANDLPIGEPTDRSDEGDAGRIGDAGRHDAAG